MMTTWRRGVSGVLALAAAAVVVVVVGGLALTRDGDNSPPPIGPPTTPTQPPIEPDTGIDPLPRNGRIQTIEDYLGEVRQGCDGCSVDSGSGVFDQGSGTVLFSSYHDSTSAPDRLKAISVVSPDGTLADLTCGKDLACPGPDGQVMSGPGADELTFWAPDYGTADQGPSADQQLQVVGFDGTVRLTIDLRAGIPQGEFVSFVAWSPDGSRLAVRTRELTGTSWVYRIWLVARDGGEPQLAYTASDTGPDSDATTELTLAIVWSPDSSRLAMFEERGWRTNRSGRLVGDLTSTQVVSLLLPEPGQQEPGTKTTLQEFVDSCGCSSPTLFWSPDGTRVVVIDPNPKTERLLELSAEDGSILARHDIPCTEFACSPLIWPARPR